jgi:hypothetical protein
MKSRIFKIIFETFKSLKKDEALGPQLWDRLLFNSIQSVSKWITSGRGSRNRRKRGTCDVQGLGFGERGLLNIRNSHAVSQSRFIGMRKCRHPLGAVQKDSISPVLRPLEGKAAGHLARGTYRLYVSTTKG